MSASRTFHAADLITVARDRLLSPRSIEAVYDVVDFVTGQPHLTHQLPGRAQVIGEKYGEFHKVAQLPEGAYVGREPVAELREMVGPDKPIIVVGDAPDDLGGGPRMTTTLAAGIRAGEIT